jgi:hypothetical protein
MTNKLSHGKLYYPGLDEQDNRTRSNLSLPRPVIVRRQLNEMQSTMKSTYKDDSTIPILEPQYNLGRPVGGGGYRGEGLKNGRTGDVLRFSIIGIYAILIFGLMLWTYTGPSQSSTTRVLRTRDLPVDQLYSGFALSAIFTPLAIILRITAGRMGKIHPFMVARRRGIKIADLDRMSEGGLMSAWTIFRYSLEKGFVQAGLILAGAVLVPLATLMVTTGVHTTSVANIAVIGLPTGPQDAAMTLYIVMGTYNVEPVTFQGEVADLYKGELLAHAGVLPTYDKILSNTPTSNLTLTNGSWYSGLLTYQWDADCEPAPEIKYTTSVGDSWYNVTFWSPFNSSQSVTNDAWELAIEVWTQGVVNDTIIYPDMTTYYAIAGATSTLVGNRTSGVGLMVGPEMWVSTVKCKAQMDYQVSRCLWNGQAMVECTELPGANTTVLDTLGLSQLGDYLNSIPLGLFIQDDYVLGASVIETSLVYTFANNTHQYRGPRLSDYVNMYGLVASSMVQDISSGYYGTATIPKEDVIPEIVYLVRTPFLFVVAFIIFGCLGLTICDLVSTRLRESPVREMSFMAVAAATRGQWWDDCVDGLCAATQKVMRKRGSDKVTFGVDVANPRHIGLAPRTTAIIWSERYRGNSIRTSLNIGHVLDSPKRRQ